MKKLTLIMAASLAGFAAPAFAGNIANCEVVLLEPMEKDGIDTGGRFASFRPAAEFISSIYDDEDGYARQLDGHDIRGVMCTRRAVIPTLRDFPILASGIPFSISDNFDAPDSKLMTLYFKDGEFKHIYSGAPLTETEQDELSNVMEVFNLQPHDLGANEDDAALPTGKLTEKSAENIETEK